MLNKEFVDTITRLRNKFRKAKNINPQKLRDRLQSTIQTP